MLWGLVWFGLGLRFLLVVVLRLDRPSVRSLVSPGRALAGLQYLVVPTEVVVAVQEKRFRDRFWLVWCGRFGFACVLCVRGVLG